MTVDVFSAILSYITIPLYVGGLLILVYFIAHSQSGFSLSKEVKKSMKAELAQKHPETPVSTYAVVILLFVLFTVLTFTSNKRRPQV